MPNKDGKYSPCLRVRVNGKQCRVSHLIMEKEGYMIKPDEVVHHIDGNSQNNKIDNLTIMKRTTHGKIHNPKDYSRFGISAKENKQFWMKHYNREKGVNRIKVTEEIFIQVKELLKKDIAQDAIAKKFNIAQSAVSRIHTGKRYTTGYGWLINKQEEVNTMSDRDGKGPRKRSPRKIGQKKGNC